ncbi:MAG: hypothetical protein JWP91_1723 [Fibrobacteres bacterium]|nr:hypothetical protein [Fibrobacterota bacterium]
MKNLNVCLTAVAVAASLASAHLKAGSLSIKGGETFTVGQKVPVTFVQSIGHNSGLYDFYFSKDAGATYSEFAAHFQGPKADGDTVKYTWTVPNSVTTKGVYRVCQLAGGECTDADYILKSGNFTIVAATGVNGERAAAAAPAMRFDAGTRNLEVSFALAGAEKVSLQAFDANGQAIATLLDGNQEAGSHSLSLFSNRLQSASGHLLFKLTIGKESFTQAWNGLD